MKPHCWQRQTFWLTRDRVMYWEEEKTLIVSDLHIGKTGHFRKNGIAVPQDIYKEDMHRLFAALQHFQPKKIVIVGDLFHSHANKELDWFVRWRNDFSSVEFLLVKGNHDILPNNWYVENNISTTNCLSLQGLLLVHDMYDKCLPAPPGTAAIICGHVHPSIAVRTGPRQEVRLPCFYFNGSLCILPAFSHFTGTYSVKPQKDDSVFAITSREIMQMRF